MTEYNHYVDKVITVGAYRNGTTGDLTRTATWTYIQKNNIAVMEPDPPDVIEGKKVVGVEFWMTSYMSNGGPIHFFHIPYTVEELKTKTGEELTSLFGMKQYQGYADDIGTLQGSSVLQHMVGSIDVSYKLFKEQGGSILYYMNNTSSNRGIYTHYSTPPYVPTIRYLYADGEEESHIDANSTLDITETIEDAPIIVEDYTSLNMSENIVEAGYTYDLPFSRSEMYDSTLGTSYTQPLEVMSVGQQEDPRIVRRLHLKLPDVSAFMDGNATISKVEMVLRLSDDISAMSAIDYTIRPSTAPFDGDYRHIDLAMEFGEEEDVFATWSMNSSTYSKQQVIDVTTGYKDMITNWQDDYAMIIAPVATNTEVVGEGRFNNVYSTYSEDSSQRPYLRFTVGGEIAPQNKSIDVLETITEASSSLSEVYEHIYDAGTSNLSLNERVIAAASKSINVNERIIVDGNNSINVDEAIYMKGMSTIPVNETIHDELVFAINITERIIQEGSINVNVDERVVDDGYNTMSMDEFIYGQGDSSIVVDEKTYQDAVSIIAVDEKTYQDGHSNGFTMDEYVLAKTHTLLNVTERVMNYLYSTSLALTEFVKHGQYIEVTETIIRSTGNEYEERLYAMSDKVVNIIDNYGFDDGVFVCAQTIPFNGINPHQVAVIRNVKYISSNPFLPAEASQEFTGVEQMEIFMPPEMYGVLDKLGWRMTASITDNGSVWANRLFFLHKGNWFNVLSMNSHDVGRVSIYTQMVINRPGTITDGRFDYLDI